jgi:hypothetical protein
MNLTPEQLAYLKSLESPKKRRKFMLDCLVKNALGESVKSVKISELENFEINEHIKQYLLSPQGCIVRDKKNSEGTKFDFPSYQTSTAPETFKKIICNALESEEGKLVGLLNFCGYSEADNKGVDLPENLNVSRDYEVGMSFNGDMLDETKKMFIYSINTHNQNALEFILSGNDPTNILNMYLLTIQKMYHHVTGLNIDFIDELFPQLKNDQSAKSNYSSEEIEIAKSLNSEREEKKWTDEDMRKAYLTAIIDWLASEQERKGFDPEVLFKKYLNRLKND